MSEEEMDSGKTDINIINEPKKAYIGRADIKGDNPSIKSRETTVNLQVILDYNPKDRTPEEQVDHFSRAIKQTLDNYTIPNQEDYVDEFRDELEDIQNRMIMKYAENLDDDGRRAYSKLREDIDFARAQSDSEILKQLSEELELRQSQLYEAYIELGKRDIKDDVLESALGQFEKAKEIYHDKDNRPHEGKVKVYEIYIDKAECSVPNNPKEALTYIDNALKIFPESNLEAQYSKAKIYYSQHRRKEALKLCREVLKEKVNPVSLAIEDVIENINKIMFDVEQDWKNGKLAAKEGKVLIKSGEYDRAWEQFDLAESLDFDRVKLNKPRYNLLKKYRKSLQDDIKEFKKDKDYIKTRKPYVDSLEKKIEKLQNSKSELEEGEKSYKAKVNKLEGKIEELKRKVRVLEEIDRWEIVSGIGQSVLNRIGFLVQSTAMSLAMLGPVGGLLGYSAVHSGTGAIWGAGVGTGLAELYPSVAIFYDEDSRDDALCGLMDASAGFYKYAGIGMVLGGLVSNIKHVSRTVSYLLNEILYEFDVEQSFGSFKNLGLVTTGIFMLAGAAINAIIAKRILRRRGQSNSSDESIYDESFYRDLFGAY